MSDDANLDIYLPSNPKDAEKISKVIDDISNMMTMISGYQDTIKEQKKAIKDDWGYTPGDINQLIKLRHKREADKHFSRQRTLEELYDTLFKE